MTHWKTGIACIMLAACGGDCGKNDCPNAAFPDTPRACPSIDGTDITEYCYSETSLVTEAGIRVDRSGMDLDYGQIDEIVAELALCLDVSIDRSCVRVKIAPDWFDLPCENTLEVFPCDLGAVDVSARSRRGACIETDDFDPDRLYCSGTVQDDHVAVVTPDLSALKHELIHIITGERDHFSNPYKRCE